ncbi:MAG: 23S rRNA (guanosine(2251)-2'-O)-methyltransferase RlmB [Pelagibacteraceae bacterium]|nr:23S rRNA (guanosine(2251)-2'-O)-methyltransferase RlmB [Pelagibacteraceae bacterium]|tara:strand:- start:47836 stop:48606 length:771 start_codon:yes stop_codon:yes gene_type:complete
MKRNNSKKHTKNKEIQDIYGIHSVKAALANPERRHLELILIEKYTNIANKYSKKVPNIKILKKNEISKFFNPYNVNQGIFLKSYSLEKKNFETFISEEAKLKKSIIVVLDQVTDPQNIGSIMRSCALLNCKAVITSKDNSPEITSSLIKSASGAIEIVNYFKVVNLKRVLNKLKKEGYWIFAFDNSNNENFIENNLSKKSVFVFGSEGGGIRPLIKKQCDEIISLKSKQNQKYNIESFNVSNAATIALYEYFKKFS